MRKILLTLILFLFFREIIPAQTTKEIVAYFPQWGPRKQAYYVKYIESSGAAEKLTVINYAFAVPGPDSLGNIVVQFLDPYYDYQQVYNSEMSIDGIADDSSQQLRGNFNQLKKLKQRHPHLKLVISIGGWEGSKYFSDAVLTPESREIFANSCIETFIKGNLPEQNGAGGKASASGIFDGIDIDWEFPVGGGLEGNHYNINDRDNLTEFFALLRKKLNEINPSLLLTSAIPAGEKNLDNFNINKDQQYLDWFLLMTYDYAGSWDKKTGHHTNLFSANDTLGSGNNASFDKSIRLLMNKYKVSNNKILGGAAFYGRGWGNVEPINNGLYQPGKASESVIESGFNLYNNLSGASWEYEYYWDEIAMAPFLYSKTKKIFWTLDDPNSIALKCRYADSYNLRGVFFWEISGDDNNGTMVNSIFSRNMPDIVTGSFPEAENPEIKIISPEKSEKYSKGSDVIIKVETNTSTKKVEFFCDKRSIGFDTKPPFTWVWFNIKKGTRIIKAVAENINGKKTSRSVKVFVK